MNLRTAVIIHDTDFVRKNIDSVIGSNYKDISNVSVASTVEFFFPFMVRVFYLERGQEDPEKINYLTTLLGTKMLSMKDIPHSRITFTKYFSDHKLELMETKQLAEDLNTNISVSGMLTFEQFGDLSLFNSGILFPFVKTRRHTLDETYFREVGTKTYRMASTSKRNVDKKQLYSSLSRDFLFYEDGLRDLASRFIWGGPGEYLLNELERAKGKTDINAYHRLKTQYDQGMLITEKYQKMR